MKLFVDCMNWKGFRTWREIKPSPIDGGILKVELGNYHEFKHADPIETLVMHVSMVDRGGDRRTLRLDHIYGFRIEGEELNLTWPPMIVA